MDKWEYQNKPCHLENSVVRELCKRRTACSTVLAPPRNRPIQGLIHKMVQTKVSWKWVQNCEHLEGKGQFVALSKDITWTHKINHLMSNLKNLPVTLVLRVVQCHLEVCDQKEEVQIVSKGLVHAILVSYVCIHLIYIYYLMNWKKIKFIKKSCSRNQGNTIKS